jgi:hypothetical protein
MDRDQVSGSFQAHGPESLLLCVALSDYYSVPCGEKKRLCNWSRGKARQGKAKVRGSRAKLGFVVDPGSSQYLPLVVVSGGLGLKRLGALPPARCKLQVLYHLQRCRRLNGLQRRELAPTAGRDHAAQKGNGLGPPVRYPRVRMLVPTGSAVPDPMVGPCYHVSRQDAAGCRGHGPF